MHSSTVVLKMLSYRGPTLIIFTLSSSDLWWIELFKAPVNAARQGPTQWLVLIMWVGADVVIYSSTVVLKMLSYRGPTLMIFTLSSSILWWIELFKVLVNATRQGPTQWLVLIMWVGTDLVIYSSTVVLKMLNRGPTLMIFTLSSRILWWIELFKALVNAARQGPTQWLVLIMWIEADVVIYSSTVVLKMLSYRGPTLMIFTLSSSDLWWIELFKVLVNAARQGPTQWLVLIMWVGAYMMIYSSTVAL